MGYIVDPFPPNDLIQANPNDGSEETRKKIDWMYVFNTMPWRALARSTFWQAELVARVTVSAAEMAVQDDDVKIKEMILDRIARARTLTIENLDKLAMSIINL